jgi:hypothetical protein
MAIERKEIEREGFGPRNVLYEVGLDAKVERV